MNEQRRIDQINEAFEVWQQLLEKFLLSRGWILDEWHNWSHSERGDGCNLLTDDEAFYTEIQYLDEVES
jgi:hypothetical protein